MNKVARLELFLRECALNRRSGGQLPAATYLGSLDL